MVWFTETKLLARRQPIVDQAQVLPPDAAPIFFACPRQSFVHFGIPTDPYGKLSLAFGPFVRDSSSLVDLSDRAYEVHGPFEPISFPSGCIDRDIHD